MKLQSVGNNNQKQVLILKPNTFKGNKIKPKKNDFVSLASVCKPQNYSYGPFKHIASSNNRHILKATSIVGELIIAMDKFTGKVLKRVEKEAPKEGVACYADYFYHGKQHITRIYNSIGELARVNRITNCKDVDIVETVINPNSDEKLLQVIKVTKNDNQRLVSVMQAHPDNSSILAKEYYVVPKNKPIKIYEGPMHQKLDEVYHLGFSL